MPGLVPPRTELSPLWKPPWLWAWSQNPESEERPPHKAMIPSSPGGVQDRGRSRGQLQRDSHLKSQALAKQTSLKEGEERGGQGRSWQEPRGGRKQETIKEKSNPGLGLAEAKGPCRLRWRRLPGADGASAQLPAAPRPWAVGVLMPLQILCLFSLAL